MVNEASKRELVKTEKNTGTDSDGVRYDIKYPTFTESELKNNAQKVLSMKSVCDLGGTEFDGDNKISERIDNYFNSLNNKVYSEELGDVSLSKTSRRSEIRHGLTSNKIAAFVAIPDVIQNGKVISDITKADIERIVVAAPITINGERYYMGVMLQRDINNQRLYLHDVITEKETEIKSSEHLNTTGSLGNNNNLFFTSVLQKLLSVNTDIRENSKNDKKFSLSDTDYLKVVENGDMENAQKMVDEAAKRAMPDSKIKLENGNLRAVYHGTNTGDFTVFNPDYVGMSSGDDGFFGKGFYFAYSKGEALYYGSNRVIKAFLNIKNPFDFDKELQTYKGKKASSGYAPDAVAVMNFVEKFPEISKEITISVVENGNGKDLKIAEFSKAFKNVIDNKQFEYQEVSNEFGEKETIVTADPKTVEYEYNGKKYSYKDYGFQKRFWGTPNEIDVAYEYLSNSVYEYIDMIPRTRLILDNNEAFSSTLKEMGYDGVIQSVYGDEAVAFYPSQIKSAEPVTYDNNGEVIPLSKRFMENNRDIRFSLTQNFESQIEDVLNGTFDKNNHVYLGKTPQKLVDVLGLPQLPMLMTSNHVYSCVVSKSKAKADGRYKNNVRYHNLGKELLSSVPKEMGRPLALIKSNTDRTNTDFIVVTNKLDKQYNPVIVAVKINGTGHLTNLQLDANIALSVYGKDNFKNYLNTAFKEKRILYINKNSQIKNIQGVQFPNDILNTDYSNSLTQFKRVVNSSIYKNNRNDTKISFTKADGTVESFSLTPEERAIIGDLDEFEEILGAEDVKDIKTGVSEMLPLIKGKKVTQEAARKIARHFVKYTASDKYHRGERFDELSEKLYRVSGSGVALEPPPCTLAIVSAELPLAINLIPFDFYFPKSKNT